MKIIISPAKKMNRDTDLMETTKPVYEEKARYLWKRLQGMTYQELKKLWQCNDRIAEENVKRLREEDFTGCLTPAVLAYEGIQYQYMAPQIFTKTQWSYVFEHLRILSGLYGILCPGDGVISYRLEMQAKLSGEYGKNLYDFWGDSIYRELTKKEDVILNLASKEYSKTVESWVSDSVSLITCTFGELQDGKVKVKGTLAKMARGEMVRWMAENQISEPEEVKNFQELSWKFDESRSTEQELVFLR